MTHEQIMMRGGGYDLVTTYHDDHEREVAIIERKARRYWLREELDGAIIGPCVNEHELDSTRPRFDHEV